MTALIVGYGSIGARHARILTGLGCRTMHESLQSGDDCDACTMDEGMEIVRLIEAAEVVVAQRKWGER